MANFTVLPRVLGGNVIPFPSRSSDRHREFMVRYHAADILRAEYVLIQAKLSAAQSLSADDVRKELSDEYSYIFGLFRASVEDLARCPAMTRRQLNLKIYGIGRTWLRAEGEWYDRLRELVAADEARLDVIEPKRNGGRVKRIAAQPC